MNRRDVLISAAALAACAPATSQAPAPPFPMRRGVNLGNALEAPNEGDWGYRIEMAHLDAIRDAGFDGIRLPVRWDAHADASGAIAPDFLARVTSVVEHALGIGLYVQLDCHHYEALIANPEHERRRFLAIWRGIAASFRGASEKLLFEPLNEPNGAYWSGGHLRDLQRAVIDVIRTDHPTRLVVLGPGNWNSIDALRDWRPPEGQNIAVSVHYYEPHAFTHQDAEWLGADAPRFGRDWGGDEDRWRAQSDIITAAQWARREGYALQLGEFGVNTRVPMAQRAAWTNAVRDACIADGVGWCVWDFAGAFAIWDRAQQRFMPELKDALFAPNALVQEP